MHSSRRGELRIGERWMEAGRKWSLLTPNGLRRHLMEASIFVRKIALTRIINTSSKIMSESPLEIGAHIYFVEEAEVFTLISLIAIR